MRTTTFNDSNIHLNRLICHNQKLATPLIDKHPDVTHEKLRRAVRAWAAGWRSKEAVAAEIVTAWRQMDGEDFGFHESHSRNAQKIFRWIDGDSPRYRRYITALAPAILDVLPLEFRTDVIEPDDRLVRVAVVTKECADASRASLLGAPIRELEKEIRDAIESLVRLAPPDRQGPVMASAAAMFRN
jgi:hypothetical protein